MPITTRKKVSDRQQFNEIYTYRKYRKLTNNKNRSKLGEEMKTNITEYLRMKLIV